MNVKIVQLRDCGWDISYPDRDAQKKRSADVHTQWHDTQYKGTQEENTISTYLSIEKN